MRNDGHGAARAVHARSVRRRTTGGHLQSKAGKRRADVERPYRDEGFRYL